MTIALVPWGDVIEDFLDGIGVSLDEFSSKMTGGWLFGYIEALRLQGIETVVVCFSARVVSTVRTVHTPTGARIVILRAPGIYRRLRRRMKDPYGCTMQSMFGEKDGGRPDTGASRTIWRRTLRHRRSRSHGRSGGRDARQSCVRSTSRLGSTP